MIAIIGILSSVVLASLSTARQKSRDARRISDIGQIQLALELFFDASLSYPSTTPTGCAPTACGAGTDAAIIQLTNMQFLPKTPTPPPGGSAKYIYFGVTTAGGTAGCTGNSCLNYIIGVQLERSDNTVLLTDADFSLTSNGTFVGSGGNCNTATSPEYCYDLKS